MSYLFSSNKLYLELTRCHYHSEFLFILTNKILVKLIQMHLKAHIEQARFGNATQILVSVHDVIYTINTFPFFPNSRKHISNLRYLVCISNKISFHALAVLFTFESEKIAPRCAIEFGLRRP